ncbi:MAG TPA: ABC transporter permease [Kofleriaceae bacterium]
MSATKVASRAEALDAHPARRELQAAVLALLAAIALGSILMLIAGRSPAHVWWQMVIRTIGEPYNLGQVLYKATGLVLTGLSVSIALDAGLFNIGAEGQVTAGVLACSLVGTALPAATPPVLAIPICVLAGAAAGGLVGAAIGGLKVLRNAHEVITSIMLNAIVAGLALYLGNRVIFVGGSTAGAAIAPGAQLPKLGLGGTSANASVVIAALAVAIVWWLRAQTVWGQAWRAVGQSPEAVRTTGTSVGRVQLLVMTGAGALAGLAATNFVMGHKYAFEEGLGRGFGLAGITAALLGRLHPVGIVAAALLLGLFSTGGLAVADLVPKELTEMLQGVIVLAVAVAGPLVRRLESEARS